MTEGASVHMPAPAAAVGAGPDAVPIAHYGAFLRRHKAAVAIGIVLGVAGAGLRLGLTERTYTSTVKIVAPPVPLHPSVVETISPHPDDRQQRPPRESTMDTEVQLVLSDRTLTALSRVRGFQVGRERLKKQVSVTVPVYTRILSIKVRAHTGQQARNGARVVARNYLALRRQLVADIQQRNQESLLRDLSLLRSRLRAIGGRTTDTVRLTAHGRRQVLIQQIDVIQRQLAQINDKTAQADEVVRSADLPTRPDGERADVMVSTGLGAGLLCGLLLGLIQDRRRQRIRSPAHVRRTVGLPVLAQVQDDRDGLRDAGKRLRNIINAEKARSVLLTAIPDDGSDTLAHMLAHVCVLGGTRTTILRLDATGSQDGPRHSAQTTQTTQTTDEIGMWTVPPGEKWQLSATLRKAQRESDLVVVTTATLHDPQTAVFATACDLIFLAVRLGRLTTGELTAGTTYLADLGAAPRGLVLTWTGDGRPGR